MKKVVIECSGARHIAKKIARNSKSEYSKLELKRFPDNEMNIRFLKDVRGKKVFLIQSFYGNINEKIVETLFAGYTAKDLGARKINLVALYFPYLRKDKRFKPGECISSKEINKIFSVFDKVFIVDPHLHRIKKIRKVIKKGEKISSVNAIANYIKKINIKNVFFIGPDIESNQWAKSVADILGERSAILRKIRHSSRKVRIKFSRKVDLKNRNVAIIDDIISSGMTMLETIKQVKKLKTRKIYCIAIHGIFAENSLKRLQKHANIISTNTIPSRVSKIDISKDISKVLK
jgi:ribose-phosphate pyrophosphokinase|tara:strand:- start:7917 stop:8786 length:870 start_codon:yes stop_codon:yes gene_type:complete